MANLKALKIIPMLVLLSVFAAGQHVMVGPGRTEWPKESVALETNQLPAILDGVSHGFLGATFYVDHFDSRTTLLRGFIVLTNLSNTKTSIVLCLRGSSITYQMEVRDSKGNEVDDPYGNRYNWDAQLYQFGPHEAKRQAFAVRLKDYFDLKPGQFRCLFVFDERLFRRLPKDEWPMKAWSRKSVMLHCE